MGEYEPEDSRNVTGTASTPDGRWTKTGGKPPSGVPDSKPVAAQDATARQAKHPRQQLDDTENAAKRRTLKGKGDG